MDEAELMRELETLHPDSFGWALACCRREREDAEDVLQTAYLQILDGRARFDARSSFKTWVFGVIRRTAVGDRRRRMLHRLLLSRNGARVPKPAASVPADTIAERSERDAHLRAALAALSERQRAVLELVFYHDLTIEQAAGVLSISLGAARQHYERGKRRLEQLLARDPR